MTLIEQLDRIRELQGKEPINSRRIADHNSLSDDANPASRLPPEPLPPWEDFTDPDDDRIPGPPPSPLIPAMVAAIPPGVAGYRLVLHDQYVERDGQRIELDERGLSEVHRIVLRAIERRTKLELKKIQAAIPRRVRKAKSKRKAAK